jgi:DNA processing protein
MSDSEPPVSQTPSPEEKHALIALNMVPGIGGTIVRNIFSTFDSASHFLEAGPSAWRTVKGIGEALSTQLSHILENGEAEVEMNKASDQDIDLITFKEDEFPDLLKQVDDHPILLSVRGNLPIDQDLTMAIVGTRGCTFYGRKQSKRFATMLAHRGYTVVSGLARGIDSHAHEGVVQAGGSTIAVLGSGLNEVYPPENEELADEICEDGAIISELPIDTPPEGRNFPQRNRIISGLSRGVLVVEAPGRSGALITAQLALEQNREVFSIPGNIDSPESEGCNRLIQEGAVPVIDVDDILDHLPDYATSDASGKAANSSDGEAKDEPAFQNEAQETVFSTLSSRPKSIDDIANEIDLNPSRIAGILTTFEMNGLVEQHPGKRFTKK